MICCCNARTGQTIPAKALDVLHSVQSRRQEVDFLERLGTRHALDLLLAGGKQQKVQDIRGISREYPKREPQVQERLRPLYMTLTARLHRWISWLNKFRIRLQRHSAKPFPQTHLESACDHNHCNDVFIFPITSLMGCVQVSRVKLGYAG